MKHIGTKIIYRDFFGWYFRKRGSQHNQGVPFLSSRVIDKECGSNDDHLPAYPLLHSTSRVVSFPGPAFMKDKGLTHFSVLPDLPW